jgi:hypothetical protein
MDRRDIECPAAPALLDHLLRGELDAEKRTLEIDRENLVVLGLRRFEHRGSCLDSGVVHHDVETRGRVSSSITTQIPQRLREAHGNCLSDPAVPTGDNRNFVLQRHRIPHSLMLEDIALLSVWDRIYCLAKSNAKSTWVFRLDSRTLCFASISGFGGCEISESALAMRKSVRNFRLSNGWRT